MKEIPPRYNPKDHEKSIYSKWENSRLFHAEPDRSKKPFTIAIPPPNITGILHMGHALNNTLQDILIRWKRMQGSASLWVPGTDHAGIATQNVVERNLRERGITRQELGRGKFVEEAWKWREKYGNTIIMQLKRLGASCDWERTRFTMDKGLSEAVLEAFVQLYNKGLIYRGNYIINWCPRCQTALSDEEAPHQDIEGKLYYILYPFAELRPKEVSSEVEGRTTNDERRTTNKGSQGIIVATTRPETMLGDVVVAVNPKDKRYKKLVGRKLILPLTEREIEIITDDFVDKKFGTGAVKITPAHDHDDYEMAKRHNLEPITIMGPDGRMNENSGRFNGLDRFEARKLILTELEEKKLLIKIEKYDHAVGHCYRCHTVIEPYLSLQWFVKMLPLAEPAIEAVRSGKIKFHPKRWTKVYLNWMENIKDWCISRQIWWGHRLPVYYCQNCITNDERQTTNDKHGVIVSKIKPDNCPVCGGTDLRQDEDVLDTWFSSWLWPFSTLGWPEKTKDLKYFYPTSVLVTAPEILFFWVARMIMSGLEFAGEIPFSDVYIHGTVRDATGKKMSKSLGNVIDPLEIIDGFGADALRFSIIAITATGQDVFLSKEKFEIGRNFANKIWNASRFVLMNIAQENFSTRPVASLEEYMKDNIVRARGEAPSRELSMADRWILSRLNRTIESVTKALKNYKFNEAESLAYDFFWHDFCDWYVEMVKPIIADSVERIADRKKMTEKILLYVLEDSLKLLHPFMPFVTEAIWQNMKPIQTSLGGILSGHNSSVHSDRECIKERESIMIAAWPEADKHYIDKKIEADIEVVKNIIVNIRNIRSDMNIAYSKKLTAGLAPLKQGVGSVVSNNAECIKNLAHLEKLTIDENFIRPKSSLSAVTEEFNIFIPLEGVIDVAAEKARLVKKQDLLKQQIVFTEKKLKDKNFMDHAPENIVALEQEKAEKFKEQIRRLEETIKAL